MNIGLLINEMIHYFEGDVRRINHFLKVYGYAKTIGERERLDERTQEILEVAAVTHDIGIKISEQKYNSAAGNYQQIEGPAEAEKLLKNLKYEEERIKRVCWLIAHHHTYQDIQDQDYQILVEADFLVNAFEEGLSAESIQKFRDNVFTTEAGIDLLQSLYFNQP